MSLNCFMIKWTIARDVLHVVIAERGNNSVSCIIYLFLFLSLSLYRSIHPNLFHIRLCLFHEDIFRISSDFSLFFFSIILVFICLLSNASWNKFVFFFYANIWFGSLPLRSIISTHSLWTATVISSPFSYRHSIAHKCCFFSLADLILYISNRFDSNSGYEGKKIIDRAKAMTS